MDNKFAPIMHPTLHDHHRVPITFINGHYEVFVGDNQIRIFTDQDLPDILKSRLAMVKAANTSPPIEDPILIAKAYDHPPDSQMFEIGWQPCEGLYVVVIPTKDLTYMRGQDYSLKYRYVDNSVAFTNASGFTANDRPTIRTLETYIQWLHLKAKLKSGSKKS
jgi:hypothetical protein